MEALTQPRMTLSLYRAQSDGPGVLISEIFVTKEHPKQFIYIDEHEHFVVELKD